MGVVNTKTLNANTRRLNEIARAQTPVVASHRPLPPAHFLTDEYACELWDQVVTDLENIRVLLESDRYIIEQYVSVSLERRLAETLLIDPATNQPVLTYKSRSKYNINPLVTLIHQCRRSQMQCLREMGLTPNSRVKVNISAGSPLDADAVSDFFEAG